MTGLARKFKELRPYDGALKRRAERFREVLDRLTGGSGDLKSFACGSDWYGFHLDRDGWVYREWAPAAENVYLAGDFNAWAPEADPLTRLPNGDWELRLPREALHRGSRVITMVRSGGALTQHLPLYTRRAVQDPDTYSWCCEVWNDGTPYPWTDGGFVCEEPPIIYEAHVGMAGEEARISTYREFADNVLPRIKRGGYNTIQLMGIMEHPYYGSFGYQVSNFFAPSFRYGLPEDLKYLIDRAHSMGIRVLLDLVHSHAATNTLEGINRFDGTDTQFFHGGALGNHPAWGTKCFDYGKDGVIHFLLSNVKYWMTQFHFDGFRFDGVTSMLYYDRGLESFTELDQYFSPNTDADAVTYLQLASTLAHSLNPGALLIAEDMSGMPGMCESILSGGIGFDYRLGMGIPDLWVRLVRDVKDEDWSMGEIWHRMTFRNAATVAYVESHDQALVGDKTLIFRMADADMYEQMELGRRGYAIDRATALHKLTRLVTLAAGGSGYLNFMGNEFGHPEWIDFPREGNGNSYHYCRRQWSLADSPFLKYGTLDRFDRDMIAAVKKYRVLKEPFPRLKKIDEEHHVLAFERGGLVFVFNFDPVRDYAGYSVPVSRGTDHAVVFSSDDPVYGGLGRADSRRYSAFLPGSEENVLRLRLPPRTCLVLRPLRRKKG